MEEKICLISFPERCVEAKEIITLHIKLLAVSFEDSLLLNNMIVVFRFDYRQDLVNIVLLDVRYDTICHAFSTSSFNIIWNRKKSRYVLNP